MAFIGVAVLLLIISVSSLLWPFPVSSSTVNRLSKRSSLSVEEPEVVMVSPNGMFSAGFHAVGVNAYSFAIWFTQPSGQKQNPTLVWMANRDQPINGKRSKLSLDASGNLILTDAGKFSVWATNTSSSSSVELHLHDTGNLVLEEIKDVGGVILWQSFHSPTNTLLPHQQFTRLTSLVSSRSKSNHSSGFFKLFFNNDNVLRLLYDYADVSSIYWPDPWFVPLQIGRSTSNASKIAVFDSLGNFTSSDNFHFTTSDHGIVLQRRLVVDYDGNLRVYSRRDATEKWYVSWQALYNPCKVHGLCGENSICNLNPGSGSMCSCLPGYRLKNDSDLSQGCEPKHNFSCNKNESYFLALSHVDFYSYDIGIFSNCTLEQCQNLCLESFNCLGFQYQFTLRDSVFNCYPKTKLLNGYHSPEFEGVMYLKLPKSISLSNESFFEESNTLCSNKMIEIERTYVKGQENGKVKLILWFAVGIGGLEMICILLVWGFLIRTGQQSDKNAQGYLLLGTGFRNFSHSELKKATQGFSQEIGRGAGGIVYKGELPDHGVAAIKRLSEAVQGEEEFLDEVKVIGNLNHMNLIKMLGYCAEGKHRLLVYEYMENGSLAENLVSNALDFNTKFNIALGMARGLAYLHEECLEWILHCDVKPQNILLDSSYQPKVADFGLSKLLNRNDFDNSNFSRIRGTRGYMAPEWVFNLPITSKVDVYSYGIVVLEMVSGKNPMSDIQNIDGGEVGKRWRLVTWARDEKTRASANDSWLKKIIDPRIGGNFDFHKMQVLVEVALQCVQEDRDARPTMRQVVEMLQTHEND